jgi:PKD repeat protein
MKKQILVLALLLVTVCAFADLEDVIVTVSNHTVSIGETFTVAISTIELLEEWNVTAFQFNFAFDGDLISYNNYNLDGLLSDGGMAAVNTEGANNISVGFAGAYPLVGSGDIIHLEFSALNEGVTTLDLSNFLFNTEMIVNLEDGTALIGSYIIAGFSANPIIGYVPLTVLFTDASLGSPINWAWDFDNDGVIDSYEQNPIHVYTETGNYSVSLSVSDGETTDGEIKENYITVEAEPLIADFEANAASGEMPFEVQFMDTSVNFIGDITSWQWDFQNDGIIDSYLQNPTYTYAIAGVYSVSLTVSDSTNTDIELKEDYITAEAPLFSDFEVDITDGDAPLEVNFTDLSTGNIIAWMWDFDNDGTIDSNIQNPTYIYAEAGVYSVSLKITDGVTEITELKEDYITVNAVNADENEIAVVTRLNGNYPNPFTGETTISFSLSAENMEKAEVEIYNMKGQLVETFANLPITNSPNQQIIWNAEKQASGVYFYKLVVDGIAVDTKKMILLK